MKNTKVEFNSEHGKTTGIIMDKVKNRISLVNDTVVDWYVIVDDKNKIHHVRTNDVLKYLN